jgi:hypothetical protein
MKRAIENITFGVTFSKWVYLLKKNAEFGVPDLDSDNPKTTI